MRIARDERFDTSKTEQEKAQLSTAKNQWRSKCRATWGNWTKRTASKKVNGNHRMNP